MPDLKFACEVLKDRSNDHAWLHAFLLPRAEETTDVSIVRLFWASSLATISDVTSQDFISDEKGIDALANVFKGDTSRLRAVVLCHGKSADVPPRLVTTLTDGLLLDHAFIRQHFDYKSFHREPNCSQDMAETRQEEVGLIGSAKAFEMRWKSVRLPSESTGAAFKVGIEDDCMSFCVSRQIGMSGSSTIKPPISLTRPCRSGICTLAS